MFEHFKGEEVFVKKVLDYLDQVQYKQRLILTQFLDPYHQSIVKSVIGHQDEVQGHCVQAPARSDPAGGAGLCEWFAL